MFLYKEAARILKESSEKKGTVKNLVHASKFENKKPLIAIVLETSKYKSVLETILAKTNIQKFEKVLQDPWIALVSVYEFLFGQGFRKESPLKKAVSRHKAALQAELARLKIEAKVTNNADLVTKSAANAGLQDNHPRYARVNTLKVSVKNMVSYLCRDGFSHVTFHSSDYSMFLEAVKSLKPQQFMQDLHIPSLLLFAPGTDLHDNHYYKTGLLILQDKASCIPAHVLNPPPDSHVIDCCAAPGNKTTHLAAIMKNKGKIFAFDQDIKRFSTLNILTIKAGASCVQAKLTDFMKVDPNDPAYKDVKYILVDPSCSGTGIVGRMDNSIEQDSMQSKKNLDARLQKLSRFQSMLLKHALSFPHAERVVYSTCSIHSEENEGVVADVLAQVEDHFMLEEVLPALPHRGEGKLENAHKCLRLSAQEDATHGFFVACFVKKANASSQGVPEMPLKCKSESDKMEAETDVKNEVTVGKKKLLNGDNEKMTNSSSVKAKKKKRKDKSKKQLDEPPSPSEEEKNEAAEELSHSPLTNAENRYEEAEQIADSPLPNKNRKKKERKSAGSQSMDTSTFAEKTSNDVGPLPSDSSGPNEIRKKKKRKATGLPSDSHISEEKRKKSENTIAVQSMDSTSPKKKRKKLKRNKTAN